MFRGNRDNLTCMQRLAPIGLWLTAMVILAAVPAHAQTMQVWPEIDTYLKVNDRTRIFLQAAAVAHDGDATESDFGVNLDLHLKLLRRKHELLARLDESKNRAFMVRGGYRYVHSHTGGENEHRGIAETTTRYPLTAPLGDILLSDRNLVDFRDIGGAYSWRYRNRLSAERELSAGRLRVNPYARYEISYDSRHDDWSRTEWRVGSSFQVHKISELDAYFAWQNNTGKAQTRAIGVTLTFYF